MARANCFTTFFVCVCCLFSSSPDSLAQTPTDEPIHVFIFAGQSNMVGAHSRVEDLKQYPPYREMETAQPNVEFAYCIGREKKSQSVGWQTLQPVNNLVGPELSFARTVANETGYRIAIIKVAAGGTDLGADWNPDNPSGFKLYPLALNFVKERLAELEKRSDRYVLSGFMWHQGENDMFKPEFMKSYGKNLKNFLARWRTDLKSPKLNFFIGELCTKTIWGMDLRPRMYEISVGQREVTESDSRATFVPTSHVGVKIGKPVGLHYHYGTLGQLQHGENYARAWLETKGRKLSQSPPLIEKWPYAEGEKVKLFVLAGHRNMEGERAFIQDLAETEKHKDLGEPNQKIAFKYSLGGGVYASRKWHAVGPVGYYDTFGPELSFANQLQKTSTVPFAVAKFTHSGSQIIDWTPEGSVAKSRNLYPSFIEFVKESITSIEDRGNRVELAGIFYHVGENDMSFGPFRKQAIENVKKLVEQSRTDLGMPSLKWFVSQQPPTNASQVNNIDVVAPLETWAAQDNALVHLKMFDLKGREKELVISTPGIIQLGEAMANSYVSQTDVKSSETIAKQILPDPDGKPAKHDKPVKVYIMLGQSNMLGFGRVGPPEVKGSLEHLTKRKQKYPYLIDDNGNWTERKDVRYVHVMDKRGVDYKNLTEFGDVKNQWLLIDKNNFGPELGFGHVMGHFHEEPVLILKACIGNRSLGWDLLPPGSKRYQFEGKTFAGYKDNPGSWIEGEPKKEVKWYAGRQYDADTSHAKIVLENLEKYYPGYKSQGFEVAGFVFWQGHKDQNAAHASRYELNLVHLIKSLRKDFNAPEAKFVLATIGFSGNNLKGHGLTVCEAQLAVDGNTGKYPEFKGNVKTIDARPFWRDANVSPRNQGHHYNQNAETYMEVGAALGRAMRDLSK